MKTENDVMLVPDRGMNDSFRMSSMAHAVNQNAEVLIDVVERLKKLEDEIYDRETSPNSG